MTPHSKPQPPPTPRPRRQARTAAQRGRRLLHTGELQGRQDGQGPCSAPILVAAWDGFENADKTLRSNVEAINDKRALVKLAAIEQSEGKQARYHVEALMIQAKRVLRAEDAAKPDVGAITAALTELEGTIKAAEEFPGSGAKGKIGSLFMSNAKSFLTTAKQLMRRIHDKVPYSSGDKMMLSNAGSGWMVEGSPPRLLRDHNQLVESYNRGANI
jgi:hypothetical protein